MESFGALAGLAGVTSRVRLGPLVANIVLRPPAVLALQARTLAQVSDGRAELAVGAGYAASDHDAAGVPAWSATERAARFAAAVALLDDASDGPPLVVAAHGPRALALAARHADTWVSYGGFGLTHDALLALTARRAAALADACRAIGRDPATMHRRLLCGSAALTAAPLWRSPADFLGFARSLADIGIDELALHFPPENVHPAGAIDPAMVERIAREAFPAIGP
jgi:alkanesulfonate monooxygenase SsuD/methylene tetrahydromethanopterin reductase-like flavin-dependent oxidoreductase (luciferase family)